MHEFPCPVPITIDVYLAAGIVEVHAEQRDTAVVEVSPCDGSNASLEAARQVVIGFSNQRLGIAHGKPDGALSRSPRLHINARVPAGSNGRFRGASTDVTCRGEWSEVQLKTVSGNTCVDQVTGDLAANTAGGQVQVGQVDGKLTVRTDFGDITALRAGSTVDIKTRSGDVQVYEANDATTVQTASGTARIGAVRRGKVRIDTGSGDASVGVVVGTRARLDLNSLSGETSSDLKVAEGAVESTGHELTVRIRTSSGNIAIHRATRTPST